jgi:hypothetical protein
LLNFSSPSFNQPNSQPQIPGGLTGTSWLIYSPFPSQITAQ